MRARLFAPCPWENPVLAIDWSSESRRNTALGPSDLGGWSRNSLRWRTRFALNDMPGLAATVGSQ